MTLRAIVAALGGELYQGGRRANIPAPGHSPADRSVSLLLEGDRLVIHGFGAADWRDVRYHLRDRGLIDADGRVAGGSLSLASLSTARPVAGARMEVARRLWAAAIPITKGDLCARHLRRRGIEARLEDLEDLRRHPAAPVSVFGDGGRTCPALVAAVRCPEGRVSAVELTYLDPGGRRAEWMRLSRKTVGLVPAGAEVRLAPPGPALLVAEGVMTALSASARFGLPGWALLSAGNLARCSPPAGVRRILIAGDRGPAGEAAAAELCGRLRGAGLAAEVRLPPSPCGDWNEAAVLEEEEGRGGAPAGRGPSSSKAIWPPIPPFFRPRDRVASAPASACWRPPAIAAPMASPGSGRPASTASASTRRPPRTISPPMPARAAGSSSRAMSRTTPGPARTVSNTTTCGWWWRTCG